MKEAAQESHGSVQHQLTRVEQPSRARTLLAPPLQMLHAATAPVRKLAEWLLLRPGPLARSFETLILVLIVLSVASIAVEALPGLPYWARRALRIEEIVVVTVFSFEYVLRIVAAPEKLAFIVSFRGVVDLLSIAPFFLSGLDTRWLRVLRLLRLVRVLKLQTHVLENTVAERTRELRSKNAALEQAQAQIKAELDVARALQSAILPATFPAIPGCDGAARMIAATTMCGDFYDFIELPQRRIGLVMADVCGHGIPAAFFMAVARTSLRDVAAHFTEPGACLAHTNEALCAQNPLELFVTVFYGVFDPATGVLRYANGGHNPPYLRRADGSIATLDGGGGIVLGALAGAEFPDHAVTLQPGERIVLYTDGVTEACDSGGAQYGAERLVAQIQAHGAASAGAIVEHICASVAAFAGTAAQSDDITLAVLARNTQ
jgi:sigma-B regulation protein RsbU (phosphoserine phosphatase)